MSARNPSARLFVAVDPPAEVRAALAAWARTAARALRILDPELLHVTICFLGERPLQEVDSISDQLAACERPAVELSLGAPLWLPPRRPRALAVELHDKSSALARLHAELVARLAADPDQTVASGHPSAPGGAESAPRRRRFRPHVTVARMRSGDAPRERALPPTPTRTFSPNELVLYRSWLSPEGASYERLASYPLG
jgi:RNA 2',3'-cyclic 3'-phosphodiesterase